MRHTHKDLTMTIDGGKPAQVDALTIGNQVQMEVLEGLDKVAAIKNLSNVLITSANKVGRATLLQQFGRLSRGRIVHAQRARKLRRRGERVVTAGHTANGKAIYRWFKTPIIIDFTRKPANLAWTLHGLTEC